MRKARPRKDAPLPLGPFVRRRNPTLLQIKKRSAAIQATWDARTERLRRGGANLPAEGWLPPTITVSADLSVSDQTTPQGDHANDPDHDHTAGRCRSSEG